MALLRHLALRCRNVETSRTFYEDILGFTFVGYRGNGTAVDLSDGTSNITLLPHEGKRPVLEEGEEYIHFGIIVDDLTACWQRCLDWGAEISKGDVKDRSEVEDLNAVPERSFKVLDPDGNVIDITANRAEWKCVSLPD